MLGEHIARVAHELAAPAGLLAGSVEETRLCLDTLVRYMDALESAFRDTSTVRHLRAAMQVDETIANANRLAKLSAQGTARLTHLVDQLRMHARGRSVARQFTPAALDAIITEALQHASYGCPRVPLLDIDVPADLQVRCERPALVQAFLNLFRNAFDALQATTAARLWISARPLESPQSIKLVRVCIRDNGPGIDTAYRSHVFEPFFTSKGDEGLGLGLAIAKSIIGAHGGSIALSDTCSDGAEFILHLPAAHLHDNTDALTASGILG
jgi:C4-dicarboxylate-specific signal transduction histidine kinase